MKKIFYLIVLLCSLAFFSVEAHTYTVSNISDSGPGSLRQAILDANSDPDPTTLITFHIPGSGPHTIFPNSSGSGALPAIIKANVTIDGTSQTGFTNFPLIIINGSNLTSAINPAGLTIANGNSNCTIKSLVINNFVGSSTGGGVGIQINGSNNTILGCYIGTDALGTSSAPNNNGVLILDSGNTIGGEGGLTNPLISNLISGNVFSGIQIIALLSASITHTTIQGNLIGVNQADTAALPNGRGIALGSQGGFTIDGTIIGGSTSATGNVISGNNPNGIEFLGGVTNSVIQGNFIGTDTTGTVNLGNAADGLVTIPISGTSNTHNLIGGTASGEGNVIAFNGQNGVNIIGASSFPNNFNAILENSIFDNIGNGIRLQGTDANHQQPFPTISSAVACSVGSSTSLIIHYTAPTFANTNAGRLEFFNNPENRNPITEGKTFLGAVSPVASGSSGTIVIPGSFTGFVSGTATNLNGSNGAPGDTSEFSLNTPIQAETLVATVSPSSLTICPGASGTLTTTITGSTSSTFNLSWSDGLVQSGVGAVSTRTITASGTYTVVATDTATDCQSGTSNSATVVVDPITIQLAASSTAICSGQSTTLTADVTGTPPFTVAFSDGTTMTGSTSPITFTVSPTSTTTFTATITDAQGCTSLSNAVTVNVINIASVNLTAVPNAINLGQQATLTATFNSSGPVTLVFSDGATFTDVTSPFNRAVTPAATTTYVVTAIQDGCQVNSNGVTVTVNANNHLRVKLCADRSHRHKKCTAILRAKILSGLPPFELVWSDGFKQKSCKRRVTRKVFVKHTTSFNVTATSADRQTDTSNSVKVKGCRK